MDMQPALHQWGKSNDPTSPEYVPSLFKHTTNEARIKAVNDLEKFDRVVSCKKRRIENHDRAVAAEVLPNLSETGNGEVFCEPHTGVGQRRYNTIDLCVIIAKLNCIPMEIRDAKMVVQW